MDGDWLRAMAVSCPRCVNVWLSAFERFSFFFVCVCVFGETVVLYDRKSLHKESTGIQVFTSNTANTANSTGCTTLNECKVHLSCTEIMEFMEGFCRSVKINKASLVCYLVNWHRHTHATQLEWFCFVIFHLVHRGDQRSGLGCACVLIFLANHLLVGMI